MQDPDENLPGNILVFKRVLFFTGEREQGRVRLKT